jgi:hypothetical protein
MNKVKRENTPHAEKGSASSAPSTRRRKSQRLISNRDGAYLLEPRYRASVRQKLTEELELLRAQEEAGHLYVEAERKVRAFGDALDRISASWRALGFAPSRDGGRGELMWAGAMAALHPEQHPVNSPYPTVWGIGPYALPTADVEWVGRAAQYADDDLIADVLYRSRADRSGDGRARALARVRQMRDRHRKFVARRETDIAALESGEPGALERMKAPARRRRGQR